MRQQDFEALKFIRHEIPTASGVFVPFVGSCWKEKSSARIMICGKATYGFDWGETIERQEKTARKFISEDITADTYKESGERKNRYQSTFWTFAWEVVSASQSPDCTPIVGSSVEDRKRFSKQLYWSNLVKVGDEETGNLPNKLVKKYGSLFTRVLRQEIKNMSPNVVVFTTGNYGWPIVQALSEIPDDKWIVEDSEFWYFWHSSLSTYFVWTRHPQAWAVPARRQAATRIARLARRAHHRKLTNLES